MNWAPFRKRLCRDHRRVGRDTLQDGESIGADAIDLPTG